tara:strand:+ start:4377 stop:5468 length:1092 start_codon:yes stop_codon:yes gene_type:complete
MIKRFYLLDFARGIAALCVVIWHYNHFYYLQGINLPDNFIKSQQPFYKVLWLFYENGNNAVLFFFCLSGFIFFWLYLKNIKENRISSKEFFLLRFSRLYPLHFLTLLFVAIFQYLFLYLNGNFIVYPFNDLKHFILNIFLISHWGFQDGWSFNAPIWSVSMEFFVYCFFFILAKIKLGKLWHIVIILLLAYLISKFSLNFGIVIFFFFIGGGSFLIYEKINTEYKYLINNFYTIFFLFLTIFIIIFLFNFFTLKNKVYEIGYLGLIFSLLILTLAFLQNIKINLGKKISMIGDLTYSIYLIHFPLQLTIIGTLQYIGYEFNLEKKFFIIFFILLLFISYLTYNYFEVPSQKYFRKKIIFNKKV